jgi:cytochrome b pre-mRNA-processing protein 3
MLRFLFPRLTAEPAAGVKLFDAITREAREPHWYVEGEVPDTLDGRFAVLATLTALVLVRLERGEEGAGELSIGLTERFIAVMESEHRELGLGDPTLGRTVRKLVSALSRRVDRFRSAMERSEESLYPAGASAEAISHSRARLGGWRAALDRAGIAEIAEGKLK